MPTLSRITQKAVTFFAFCLFSHLTLQPTQSTCFADNPPNPAPLTDDAGAQELIDARAQQAKVYEQMNAMNPATALANPQLSNQLSGEEIATALKKIRDEGLPLDVFPEKLRPFLTIMNKPEVRLRWLPWMELLQSPAWLASAQALQKNPNMNLVSGLTILLFVITFFMKRKSLANADTFGARLFVRLMVSAVRWGGTIIIASVLLGAPFNQMLKLLGPVMLKTITGS